MAFNIEAFKARGLAWGGARPNLFRVTVTFPQIASAGTQQQAGGQFLISATQLPVFRIEEVRVPYFGRSIKLKGDRIFQDWTVTVLNDEDFVLRNAFEAWSNYMNYLESNIMDPAFVQQAYKQDMLVEQFAKDGPPGLDTGRVIKTYQFIGAWPMDIGAIPLDWTETNRVEQFDVTFAYDEYIPGGPTAAPAGLTTF